MKAPPVQRPLFADRWADGTVDPRGYEDLEEFRLEGTTPVWTYAWADARLERRVFMEPGTNTTYVRYTPPPPKQRKCGEFRSDSIITRATPESYRAIPPLNDSPEFSDVTVSVSR